MDYPRCETCAFWGRSAKDPNLGLCVEIKDHPPRTEDRAWIRVFGDDSAFVDDAVFMTRPDFGCVLHSDLQGKA